METKKVVIIFAVIIAVLLLIDIALVVVCILFRDFRYEKKTKAMKPFPVSLPAIKIGFSLVALLLGSTENSVCNYRILYMLHLPTARRRYQKVSP